ncbi:MoaD/ThiS family protein [Acidaminobacter sp. JC074]|uniref:MoaD/ThiS family protein n=1 Tax=Acidaminobacter sp. JC074 TaxID=2530199 RepID=UPI001F10B915|nr:MoaD/ThiS family protein [Acidaminobacter sp. JC074]
MEVTIEVSGLIEKALGCKEKTMDIPEKTTVKELIQLLDVRINESWLVISVNGQTISKNAVLSEMDRVKILPICGGG